MGGGGKIVDVGDEVGEERLNQKTVIMETGGNINTLATTYPGQLAFCTSTGSGFTVDVLYQRDAANAVWNTFTSRVTSSLTETAEQNTTGVAFNSNQNAMANKRYYAYFTLPTDKKFYIITKIRWRNGVTLAGNVICGIDAVDADPPVLANTEILALGNETAQTPSNNYQTNSLISSKPISGGTICGAWINFTSSTSQMRILDSQPNAKYERTITDSGTAQTLNNNTSFSNSIVRAYINVYYRGYG